MRDDFLRSRKLWLWQRERERGARNTTKFPQRYIRIREEEANSPSLLVSLTAKRARNAKREGKRASNEMSFALRVYDFSLRIADADDDDEIAHFLSFVISKRVREAESFFFFFYAVLYWSCFSEKMLSLIQLLNEMSFAYNYQSS